ncbi:M48 family metallopeptidase [Mesoflavibacter sp. SCSIO 43206]|uniref:tetratricopeptide repeat protein n=1 Tax=Mesoflavibacter sp. SCSIO 43206 TaxID=2779362 RepID=UPI001CA9ED65|nr:tetratricopeptide repeat protein [Mesoflavibacter sp. SCSIO 43206]UAB74146.1 tetratricopeptide repeat protein [Mesoflavibacter sp. SCSIO 43206]
MEEQDYILFEDYLSGNLDENATNALETRLETDKAFKQSFSIYKDISAHLDHEIGNEEKTMDFRANLDSISHNYFSKLNAQQEEVKVKKSSGFYKFAIAASVVLLLGFFVFNQFSGDPSYSDFANYDQISLTVRGDNDGLLKEAETAFNTKNYEEAELLFNQILEQDSGNTEIQLYKSITLIETNQFSEADELLKGLSEGNSIYKNKAMWYLALSKLKQDNLEACKNVLKNISEDAEDYNQAQKLLNKLD